MTAGTNYWRRAFIGFGADMGKHYQQAGGGIAVFMDNGANGVWLNQCGNLGNDDGNFSRDGWGNFYEGLSLNDTQHLRLVMQDRILSVYVNDDPTPTKFLMPDWYDGGYIYFASNSTGASFANIKIKEIPGDAPDVYKRQVMGALVAAYLLRAGFQHFVGYYGHLLGVRMEADMRQQLFAHLQTLPFKFYDKNRTGHLMSRVVNDLFEVVELAHHGPEDVFISLVTLPGAFVILLTIEWKLALMIFALVPVVILFTAYRRRQMNAASRKVKERTAGINADIESSISLSLIHISRCGRPGWRS